MIIATHSGKFHADDVFGVSLLLQLFPDAQVVRTRDPERIAAADLVLDVGGVYDPERLRFDHHQNTSGARDNGVLYSSFGLLWQRYGNEFCGGNKDVWRRIGDSLVQAVDAVDNGQDLYTLSDLRVRPIDVSEVLGWFTPVNVVAHEDVDVQFREAVDVATKLLLRLRAKTRDLVAGEQEFLAAYRKSADPRLAVLDRFVPHTRIAAKQEKLLFVVFPDSGGDWRVQTVKDSAASFASRVLLPAAWRGLEGEELARVSGVADAVFCHKAGFIAGARSKEGVLALARSALDQPEVAEALRRIEARAQESAGNASGHHVLT